MEKKKESVQMNEVYRLGNLTPRIHILLSAVKSPTSGQSP